MPPTKQRRSLTLAWLESLYFDEGHDAARKAFESLVEPRRNWAVVKQGQGGGAHRTDLREDASITYEDYSPPASWQPTFAVLLATVSPGQRSSYVSHEGEELVIPIERKIQFHYFWSPGHGLPAAVREDEIEYGSILRLNPTVPHHAAGVGGPAKAWVIIRHSSHAESAVSVEPGALSGAANSLRRAAKGVAKLHGDATGLTAKQLKQPGRYSLIAWGLAARLKNYRERSNLRISEVAEACGINHTHLSRIESGATNISLDALLRLARFLRVDIGEFFSSRPWKSHIDHVPSDYLKGKPPLHRCWSPPNPHYLHPAYHFVSSGRQHRLKGAGRASRDMATYIMLSGRLIANFNPVQELLTAGCVMHLTKDQEVTIEALEDCIVLEVLYSNIPPPPS